MQPSDPEDFLRTHYGLRVDNPGERWMSEKQEDAQRNDVGFKTYVRGSTSAWFRQYLDLPTDFLKTLPGARNEEQYRHESHQYHDLSKKVDANGWDHDAVILVVVNHLGQPYIVEGNHRTAVAFDKGRETIKAEVHYVNGAECVEDGPLSFGALSQMLPEPEPVEDSELSM